MPIVYLTEKEVKLIKDLLEKETSTNEETITLINNIKYHLTTK